MAAGLEVEMIARGGKIIASLFREIIPLVIPGVSTADLSTCSAMNILYPMMVLFRLLKASMASRGVSAPL